MSRENEASVRIDDIVFEAGVALNNVAMSKQSGLMSASSMERAAQLLADMPEEALKSLLRGRNGRSDKNPGTPETVEATI